MIAQSFNEAFERVKQLVATFQRNEKQYLSPAYSEAQARLDFIDKLWIALGWDVNHETQTNPYEQEVKVERGVASSAGRKRADYAFLAPNFHDVRFYVEAKKPSQGLDNADDYFQTIRYGWNSHTLLAVLTNFEQFRILDCRYKPDLNSVLQRAVKKYHYTEYADLEKFREIYYLFSCEAVINGALEKFIGTQMPKATGKAVQRGLSAGRYQSIDEAFLQELDEYRAELARAFKNRNPQLDSAGLTEITQRTLDRLVFMRFLEDKLIEPETLVERLGTKGTAWQDFVATSRRLDTIYNGIIFKKHDLLDAPTFQVDEHVFAGIRENLAHTNSPYDFNAIPIHILGSIYERFLGKTIVATDKRARVEEKPEVRKAGGVYYTPQYIVRYIVENTVGKLIEGKTPEEIRGMCFADIACGSGSFLLGVYDLLLRYHTAYYNRNKTSRAKGLKAGCRDLGDGALQLSLWQKREILLNNIYGVDIDAQAVEVAQLSLYLKLLEDETPSTAHNYQLEFREALLPSLNQNIICGNSLIGWDVLDNQLFSEDERQLNPMSFEDAFPQIMKSGGFNAIVGNPPYIRIHNLVEHHPLQVAYLQHKYTSATFGKIDIYVVFIEKALNLLNESGLVGYIVPNKFMQADYGRNLRGLVTNNKSLRMIIDFGSAQVFENATTYTCLLFLGRDPAESFTGAFNTHNEAPQPFLTTCKLEELPISEIHESAWVLASGGESKVTKKIESGGLPLPDFIELAITGVKTGANSIFTFELLEDRGKYSLVSAEGTNTNLELESQFLYPYCKAESLKRYAILPANRLILYPYESTGEKTSLISEGNLKAFCPRIWEYLLSNKKLLEGRQKGKLKGPSWYGLSFASSMKMFLSPKIVTATLAPFNSFAFDENKFLFPQGAGGGCGLVPKPSISAKYLLGLLNSKLLTFYFQRISSRFQGGWFAYEPRYLDRIPIRKINFSDYCDHERHDRMVKLVEQVLEAKKQLAEARTDGDKTFYKRKCDSFDRQIDELVYELYELTDKEIKLIEESR